VHDISLKITRTKLLVSVTTRTKLVSWWWRLENLGESAELGLGLGPDQVKLSICFGPNLNPAHYTADSSLNLNREREREIEGSVKRMEIILLV
jgi:hypothetical protein